ncbi:MAG: hypothetical protein KAJ19_28540, partial [Gammaproteobacteria bacterium]|nr:hypothetical protein [Gammaproteobacteria bacterium]
SGELSGDGSTLRFACGGCQEKYCVPSRYAGKKFRCLACKQPCVVPALPKEELQLEADDEFVDDSPPPGWQDELIADVDNAREQKRRKDAQEAAALQEHSPGAVLMSDGRVARHNSEPEESKSSLKSRFGVPLAVTGFYIVLGLGFLFFGRGDPELKTSEAIRFNRGLIHKFAKDEYKAPKNLAQMLDLVEDGPSNEGNEVLLAMAGGEITTIEPEVIHTHAVNGTSGYLIRNKIAYEDLTEQEVLIAVYEFNGRFDFLDAIVSDSEGNQLGSSEATDPETLQSDLNIFVAENEIPPIALVVYALIVILLVGLLNGASMWTVLDMGDEPGWAFLVPVYGWVAMARVGNRPAAVGIAFALSGFIPIIGALVSVGLLIYITIGVARTFDRGVLFGLGLAFLPLIFFPTLAFATDPF